MEPSEPTIAPVPFEIPGLPELNPPERERSYHHVNFLGGKLTLRNVTHFAVHQKGTHRLKTGDGRKWIVDPVKGFAIELDVDELAA